MNTIQKLYKPLRDCMVRVTVEDANGKLSTGSAFHIGGGYLVTARHVLEGCTNIRLDHTDGFAMIESLSITQTILPDDPAIDLAVLQTEIKFTDDRLGYFENIHSKALAGFSKVLLGPLVDEAVSDDHILDEVLLMGYPRIPLSANPELVAVRGEINASLQSQLRLALALIVWDVGNDDSEDNPLRRPCTKQEWGSSQVKVQSTTCSYSVPSNENPRICN